jgi:predicted ATPase
VTADLREFLKQAFQATKDEPLEARDPRYVDLTAVRGHDDPVAVLAQTIELSEGGSLQLFSGFPGTGKTTELKRLQQRLGEQGYGVGFVDVAQQLGAVMPIDARDLLVVLLAAVDDVLPEAEEHDGDPARPSFWERLGSLTPRPPGAAPPAAIEQSFRHDADYREAVRSIVGPDQLLDVHARIAQRLRSRAGQDAPGIVLIFDSVEHVRGTSTTTSAVQQSVESVFTEHVDFLKIAGLHLVCTIPPHLRASALRTGRHRESAPLHILPAIAARDRDGAVRPEAVAALKTVMGKRLAVARLVGDDAQIERLIFGSGGNLRDLLRLWREVVLRADSLPVPASAIDAAIAQRRAELSPIAPEDVEQLTRFALTRQLPPGNLVRWIDAHLVLAYRNGSEWYDLHPIIQETVAQQARDLAQRSLTAFAREPEAGPVSPKLARTIPLPAASAVLTPDMRVALVVENYRALRRARWTLPRGVSALVGPNGSGKTTLLDVPEFLRHALMHDARKAIDARGGPGSLRSAEADRGAPVVIGVELDQLTWELDLSPKGAAFNPLYGERATLSGELALDRRTVGLDAEDDRPMLRRFAEQPGGAAFRPLVALLEGYRLYGTYDLASIRLNGSQVSSDEHLHPDGRNIFSVLRNWRDRAETRPRWEFVRASLRESFPDTFDDLDFDMAGQTVSGRIVAPHPAVRIPTYFAANGWLVALLHLAAVASTSAAGVVAIDEMENGLHPYAIRALVDAMRGWAEATGISIVLATHSPVVLDQFKDAPDHVFVMEPGREPTPTPLDELHDPDWLAHFSLGDLYAHDEFGAQHKDDDRVA